MIMKQIFDSQMPTLTLETGSKRVMMCTNEEVETVYDIPPVEGAEPVARQQYKYDVDWLDPEEKTKGAVVDAIIRTRYSLSDELAIQRHYSNSKTTYKQEWEAYNEFCEWAKQKATEAGL